MDINKLVPNKDRLIIERYKEEVKSVSVIILEIEKTLDVNDSNGIKEVESTDNTYYANVVAAGPDSQTKQGHKILVGKYSGAQLHKDFPQYWMIRDTDVLAYIRD